MKQLPLILNAVLIIAVILLYVLFFSWKKGQNGAQKQDQKIMKFDSSSASKVSMVYVNTDSLLLQYGFAKELNDQLVKKQKQSKANLESKAAGFQKEAEAFQDKVQRGAFLSQQSAEAQQQELLKKQQGLQQLEYDLTSQLAKEQQDLNKRLYDSITNYLKIYNLNHNYQFILGHTPGGGLLYANEGLDITTDVVKALNERYTLNKAKK